MPIDPTNSKQFAQRTIQAALDTVAKQQDQKQYLRLEGGFKFNPQMFQLQENTLSQDIASMNPAAAREYLLERGQLKAHAVLGPILFRGVFNTSPNITFGQYPQPINTTSAAISVGTPDSYMPFLVTPFINSWHQAGGQIDGFYLGVYALTIPTKGVNTHTISWQASGRGSRYTGRDQQHQAAWTQQFSAAYTGNFLVDSGS